jgi:hypothetical protein
MATTGKIVRALVFLIRPRKCMCLVMHVNDSLLNWAFCSSDGFNGESLRHMSEVHLMGLASTVNCVVCNE